MKDWQGETLVRLDALVDQKRNEFESGHPFPHCVIDGLFGSRLIKQLINEFPLVDDPIWERSDQEEIQVKLRSNWQTDDDIKPETNSIVHFLNSGAVMNRLSSITRIEKLISDPYYTGGGLNCTRQGGLLDVHVDGNWHQAMGVHRRLNVILYLNENWQSVWGDNWNCGIVKSLSALRQSSRSQID